jgi:hypothetical protein
VINTPAGHAIPEYAAKSEIMRLKHGEFMLSQLGVWRRSENELSRAVCYESECLYACGAIERSTGFRIAPMGFGATPEAAIEDADREYWRRYHPEGRAIALRERQIATARSLPADVLLEVLGEKP